MVVEASIVFFFFFFFWVTASKRVIKPCLSRTVLSVLTVIRFRAGVHLLNETYEPYCKR